MIEEIIKIKYKACEGQKNDSHIQCKMADNLNWLCPELNTITESNKPQKWSFLNENRVVEQG